MTTKTAKKRPLQVALNLPEDVEMRIRQHAEAGFRTISKEIVMRLMRQDEALQKAAERQGVAA